MIKIWWCKTPLNLPTEIFRNKEIKKMSQNTIKTLNCTQKWFIFSQKIIQKINKNIVILKVSFIILKTYIIIFKKIKNFWKDNNLVILKNSFLNIAVSYYKLHIIIMIINNILIINHKINNKLIN